MRTFYFDTKDGVPVRDRTGQDFASTLAAIAHSKELAIRLRAERPQRDKALSVIVLDESGAEIHREPVFPDAS